MIDINVPAASAPLPKFDTFGFDARILAALSDLGHESPTPIQVRTIPLLLEGKDVLAQAQTGTGKTGAFALPLLSKLDPNMREPQVLVLTPTRELAMQVAASFEAYGKHMKDCRVVAIYGGADFRPQLIALKRGVNVVVGTPGRVMDHVRQGTLNLASLRCLVLDEADEMLRMGFVEDVEWVLQQTPPERQLCLFSATMPNGVRNIAKKYLRAPEFITIKSNTTTAETIRQRYVVVQGRDKIEALDRVLSCEPYDGVLVFVRTKVTTIMVAEELDRLGYACSPLNGDMPQKERERTVERLKNGQLDIIIGTDVAARGLDVDRISHVINFDAPSDAEVYVHRIGRTGRAGRTGEAISFFAPREQFILQGIERSTRQRVEAMRFPTNRDLNAARIMQYKARITEALTGDLAVFEKIITEYAAEHSVDVSKIAAALGKLAQGTRPLLLSERQQPSYQPERHERSEPRQERSASAPRTARAPGENEPGMERYRVEVGTEHGASPANIVGAIAGTSGLNGRDIGRIEVYEKHSFVDLPEGMPKAIFHALQNTRIAGQPARLSSVAGAKPSVAKPPAAKLAAKSIPHAPKHSSKAPAPGVKARAGKPRKKASAQPSA